MADSEDAEGSSGHAGPPTEEEVVDWRAVMGNPEPAAVSTGWRAQRRARKSERGRDDEDSIPVRRIALVVAGLVAAYFVANFVDVWLASNGEYEGDAPAAVVLGAAQYNGEPSAALRGRLDRAAELYAEGRVEMVVVTGGGQADDVTTEAKTGYDYLRDTASIPDGDLRLEVDGTSTYLSLAAAARFLNAEGVDAVILVTDPYHAKRSRLIAQEVGLTANVVPTDSSVSIGRLVRESGATAVGRLVGFRRLDAYVDL